MAASLNLKVYNCDYVWEKFKNKNYKNKLDDKLKDLKRQATQMTEYVFSRGVPVAELHITSRAWMKKRHIEKLSNEQLHAKVFSLSLKTARQLKEFKGKLKIPQTLTTQKGEKQAPFIRLFGSETKFYVLKSQVDKERYGVIFLKLLGEGAHNTAHLVYVVNYGEDVYRSLKARAFDKLRLSRWASDNVQHQNLLTLGVPGIVKLRNVFVLNDAKKNPLIRSTLLEKCDGDLGDFPGTIKEAEGKKILLQILTTISQMHANGFVHGDLKLGNFLYVMDKEGIVVKLGDFETAERASLGFGGTNTPEYVTPTGWLKKNIGVEHTAKEDCFAIGMMALRLSLGRGFNPVVKSFRLRLLQSPVLNDVLTRFIKHKITLKQFSTLLSDQYSEIPVADFEKILDEETLQKIDQGKVDKKKEKEIYEHLFNAIVEREFKPKWNHSMKELLDNVLEMHPTSYHKLIAQLLNLDSCKRISAQKALIKLNEIIKEDELIS